MVRGCLGGWVEVCVCVCVCVCVSDPRFIQFALSSCYAVHIDTLSISTVVNRIKVYIERSNMQNVFIGNLP